MALASSDAYGVARCAVCGNGTTVPRPAPEVLEAAYAGWYRPAGGRFSAGGDRVLRASRARVAGLVDRISPPGPVLDVGCGDGALLDALEGRGRKAVGLERHAFRADVRAADIADCEDGWAAIVLWHSLEHLPAPRRVLHDAASRLAPGGVLVVAVPNLESLQARVFGGRWLHLDLPRHLVHMRSHSLVEALRAEGLAVTGVSYLRGGQVVFGWLHGLVGTLPGRPDLYQAVRRPKAREVDRPGARRAALLAGALLAPVALLASALEIALRRGGTVRVVARRPGRDARGGLSSGPRAFVEASEPPWPTEP